MTRTVVVVGAGCAGLAAARDLSSVEGIRVVVLEGGQRVGGRACTKQVDEICKAEFGATYLHGMQGHHVYDLTAAEGLLGPVHTKGFHWAFVESGKEDVVQSGALATMQQALRSYAEARDSDSSSAATLGQRLHSAKHKALAVLSPEDQKLFLLAWRWHEVQLMLNSCSPSSADISSAWWEVCEDLPGPNFPIPAGFQAVAERFAEGLDVRFGQVVTKVEHGPTGVRLHTASDETFTGDAAVVTVSLGVLKEVHQSLFRPPLPQPKAEAIHRLGWGYNEKIFVEFDPDACSSAPPSEATSVAYQLIWHIDWPGPGQEEVLGNSRLGGGVPSWAPGVFSFRFGGSEFKPAAVPVSIPPGCKAAEPFGEKYTSEPGRYFGNSSVEMAHVAAHCQATPAQNLPPASNHPRVACLWVSGWHAKAMAAAPAEEIKAGVAAIVDRFPAIPFTGSQIVRVWRSDWTGNPLFRGAYSYVSAVSTPVDNETLAEPLLHDGNPIVLFAGEACTATNTASTHGAVMTGKREATRLLEAWGLLA